MSEFQIMESAEVRFADAGEDQENVEDRKQ